MQNLTLRTKLPTMTEAKKLPYSIRLASASELASLPEIEMAAAQRFHHSKHPAAADGQPISVGLHSRWHAHDGVWVAESPRGELAAFLVWIPLALDMYVVEVDVHPEHAGQRLAGQLLDALAEFGSRLGFERVVLRTFRDVPWNEPYYCRLGFTALGTEHEHPELTNIRAHEASVGLDDTLRSTLYRPIRA